jgi:hypothetical protein
MVARIQEILGSKRHSIKIWKMKTSREPRIPSIVSDLHNWNRIRLEEHVVNKVDLRCF